MASSLRKTVLTWDGSLLSQRSVQSPATQNPSAQSVINDIVRSIPSIRDNTEITFSPLSAEDGALICHSLDENSEIERRRVRINFNAHTGVLRLRIMPIDLHVVHTRWINRATMQWAKDGNINEAEMYLLWSGVGTTFDDFTGAYRGSLKQPDHFLRVDTDDNPRIVVESGWSESFPHLRNDKDLWLRGNTSVVLVILLKWSAISNNRIKGTVEIWRRGPAGNNTFVTMAIFPAPAPLPPNELIQFTKADVFGQALPAGQAPGNVLDLDLAVLRNFAAEVIEKMGMQPA